jgi:hypothetical protein
LASYRNVLRGCKATNKLTIQINITLHRPSRPVRLMRMHEYSSAIQISAKPCPSPHPVPACLCTTTCRHPPAWPARHSFTSVQRWYDGLKKGVEDRHSSFHMKRPSHTGTAALDSRTSHQNPQRITKTSYKVLVFTLSFLPTYSTRFFAPQRDRCTEK